MNTMKIIGSSLYQWEKGRQLQIFPLLNNTVSYVHFSNPGDREALVVKTKEENGVFVADIPNILLQSGANVIVYAVNISGESVETLVDCTFPVRKRAKPADYVYTETEVLNYAYLDKRLKDLEGEGLAKAVAEYLKENPVEAGATAEEAAQIAQNKRNIETLNREKLAASELPNAVNEALAQAKASGAFDGEPGKDGTDGVSATHKWSGTVLTVTSASGTSSADLKGEPGKTPVKGEDYFTEADKQEIAEQAAGMVEVPDVDIPTALPNPNALTFTGAATGTYDGSAPLTVNIPEGGSGTGGGSTEWNVICEGNIAESVSSIVIDSTADGTLLETLNVNELLICGSVFLSGNSKLRFEHNGHWVSGAYSEASKECGAWATPFRVWQRKIHNVIVTEISIHSTNIVLYTYKDHYGRYYPIKSFEIHTVTENVTFLANSTEVNVYYR